MTNPSKTLIAALLDRTGSMATCKKATEDGFDEFINTQKDEPGEAVVTLAQFDRHGQAPNLTRVYSNLPIHQVPKLELIPRGGTPLLDATGEFVTEIGEHLANIPEDDRPGIVICLIMTDGCENASREWTWEQVSDLIKQQTEVYGWRFLFLGANIDAVKVGARMGMARGQTITYDSNNEDAVRGSYAVASASVASTRSGLVVDFTDEDRARAMGKKPTASSGGKK